MPELALALASYTTSWDTTSVKVILSGEGADELFAGYPKHQVEARVGHFPTPAITAIGAGLAALTAVAPARMRRLRIAGRALWQGNRRARMVSWFGALTPAERDTYWTSPHPKMTHDTNHFATTHGATALRRAMHFDQTSYLPDNQLDSLDMMTMAASLEARTPFLDIRLAEFAARLPDNWLIAGLATKRIVREALGPSLPINVVKRRKKGFSLPVAQWFRGPLGAEFRDRVLSPAAVCSDFLDQHRIARLADEHYEGQVNHDKTLWTFFALETFLGEFF